MSLVRFRHALFAGFAILAAGTGGARATAQENAPDLGQTVAMALAAAHSAQGRSDHKRLADALAVIDHSGARPLPGWNGHDPVPEWRTLVADPGPPMRGSALGPGYRSGKVLAGRSETFEQVFLSGKKASIALSTPGNAPVSLRVLDADRKLVCATRDARSTCRWIPLFTQRYVIEVRNLGQKIANYFLVVD